MNNNMSTKTNKNLKINKSPLTTTLNYCITKHSKINKLYILYYLY